MLLENFILIYAIIDDLLKVSGHKFDKRPKMSDSELLFIAVSSALYFYGNWKRTLEFLYSFHIISCTIDKSRICRRLQQLSGVADDLIDFFSHYLTSVKAEKEFILDSAPIAVCDNIRIQRCRIISGEDFRGYTASFRRYFYGVKVQLITTKEGVPVNYIITEGSAADAAMLEEIPFEMTPESKVYADAGYTDYSFETKLKRKKGISLLAQRKSNSRRKRSKKMERTIKKYRKRIETVLSVMKAKLPKRIHAVTIETILLKIKCLILGQQIQMLCL
jgi:hypothetical protein